MPKLQITAFDIVSGATWLKAYSSMSSYEGAVAIPTPYNLIALLLAYRMLTCKIGNTIKEAVNVTRFAYN